MTVAAVNWKVRPTDSVAGLFDHCHDLVRQCEGAGLIVFPENISLELVGLYQALPLSEMAGALADALEPEFGRFGQLAKESDCTLVAGTHFVRQGGQVLNCAVVALPDGRVTTDVPKIVMTQFEANEWGVSGGFGVRELPDRRFGVSVCYDCEFPGSARSLAENGALLLCVPAYTETRHGYQRVRWCCQARAIENQIYVVHASLVGNLGREPVVRTYGTSAILTPCLDGFPVTGRLAETAEGIEAVALADCDFAALTASRGQGDVRNWDDRDKGDWRVVQPTWVR